MSHPVICCKEERPGIAKAGLEQGCGHRSYLAELNSVRCLALKTHSGTVI